MKKQKNIEINKLFGLIDRIKVDLENKIDEKITFAFNQYKTNFIWGDKWCCEKMKVIAKEIWDINKPTSHNDKVGIIILKFYGIDLVYCPFCGIKL